MTRTRFLLQKLVTGLVMSLTTIAVADDAPKVFVTPEEAATDSDFTLQGEYAGENQGLQAVALGDGEFRIVIYRGGLPSAGWDESAPQVLEEEDADTLTDLIDTLELEKVIRKSPTLGATPPPGALVLFDGTEKSLQDHWKEGARRTEDGLLMQGATSRETFRDFSLHLEFRLPFMPHARGQGRANSGAYYQGRYETQILDSFGLAGKNNECGGLYEIRAPDFNACLPPLSWQTYDIDFTAARWNDAGEKTANARITVRLNGMLVHDSVELPRVTRAAPLPENPEPGPLYLQDHGNPVRFRNIWVIPRDIEREARRPRIPGFERFHAQGEQAAAGGRLLMGELNCAACHQLGNSPASSVKPKQAPILTDVGSRVRPEWMYRFISDPHTTKPGTTMPNLFDGWSDTERDEAALALTSFLASRGRLIERDPNLGAAKRGERLFHEAGCVACHLPRDGRTASDSTSVPLPQLGEKYTIASLIQFLKQPHAVRPSGRMPGFDLDDKALEAIASYLVGDSGPTRRPPNVRYTTYRFSADKLPEMSSLLAAKKGETFGLNLGVAGRTKDFAIRFESFLGIEQGGAYTFHLGSDDGSRLLIDGEKIVDVDGIHPHTVRSARVELEPGVHAITVDYFQRGGEWTLELEFEGPSTPRQSVQYRLRSTKEQAQASLSEPATEQNSIVRPELVDRGRELFTSFGCASCHVWKPGDKRLPSRLTAPALAEANLNHGCLADAPTATEVSNAIPNFSLSPVQRGAILAAIDSSDEPAAPAETIETTLTTFNCYACHERGGKGGPERSRNEFFTTAIPEMGDEGRIPPPLNGVGDKLNDNWLQHVLKNGANDRPYMKTQMPRFGNNNVTHLQQAFAAVDRRDEAELATFEEPPLRVKSTGRHLVGDQGLSCIKCHIFGPHKATGIQAINLQSMTKRLREDWFLRYLFDPQKYRPGTRMPTGFPNGQAVVRDVYEGDPQKQISAIWMYLRDGSKAGIPDGLIAQMIELKPTDRPIMYLNFIEGLSPRGIAVGYPEKAHLAWDANDLCLKRIWHNRFIDASKHWVGRGPGNQVPLGDHIVTFEPTVPLARLESPQADWPGESPKDRGYRFLGYQLDEAGHPAFRYRAPFGTVTDFPVPLQRKAADSGFQRTLTIAADETAGTVYFRAASGSSIDVLDDNRYRVDGIVTLKLTGGETPILRTSGGRQELLVPVVLTPGKSSTIRQDIVW